MAGRVSCKNIRGADRLHNSIVTRCDVIWAEAGTHLHHNGTQGCWRWAIQGRHREVVESLIAAVDRPELDWAVTNVVGSITLAKNGNILKLVSGDNDILRMLLDAGGNTCSTDDHGTSALLHAVGAGQTGIARTLLRRAQHPPQDLARALECAIRDGNSHIAVLLLLHGADPPFEINVPTEHGWPCPVKTIELLANQRQWDLMLCILKRGLRLVGREGAQAGLYFAKAGNVGGIEKLVEAGYHVGEVVLCHALRAHQDFLVDKYFSSMWARRRPFENRSNITLFLTSCALGHLVFVMKMLPLITAAEREAGLTCAARAGRYRIVELLLAAGIGTEGRQKAILEAARGGYSLVFQILLQSDSSGEIFQARRRARDLMEEAVEGGNLDIVRTCLTPCLTRDVLSLKVDDALRLAARKGRWDIARLLLRHLPVGSSPNLDWTFHDAAIGGNVQLLHALWERGVEVCGEDNQALRAAAMRGHAQAVRALLRMGATLNTKRSIALRTAVTRGHVEVVQEFLAAGCPADGCSGKDLLAAARVNRVLARQGDFDHIDEYN